MSNNSSTRKLISDAHWKGVKMKQKRKQNKNYR
jgi:hypothetical protein